MRKLNAILSLITTVLILDHSIFYSVWMLCASLSFPSCNMMEVHPYDAHVQGPQNLNEKHIREIHEQLKERKSFSIRP